MPAGPPAFGIHCPWNARCAPAPADQAGEGKVDPSMSSTFETVADIIAKNCDIPRDTITPESHAIEDLGIDSLSFLDIAFEIDKTFGIKLPLEEWTQEVNEGKVKAEEYFKLSNLSQKIDDLRAKKTAA
jgi:acyl carrier protein